MQDAFHRLAALTRKEIIQVRRDRRMLALMIGLPLIELFLFAYAVSLTVKHLPTALVDQSHDPQSRSFIQSLVNSEYFDFTLNVQNEKQIIEAIDTGTVKVGFVIPPDFKAQVERGEASVLILIDG